MLTFPFDKPVPIVSQFVPFHWAMRLQGFPSAVSKLPPANILLLSESLKRDKTELSKPFSTGCQTWAFAVNISPQEESLKRFKRQLFHRFLITPVPGGNWWVLFQ